MRYIKDIQIFNESINFINENKIEIVDQLNMWSKPSREEIENLEKILQSYDKVEFTDWNGDTQIVKVKEFFVENITEDDRDNEDRTSRVVYGIMDSEGNYYDVDNYQPIHGL